MVCLSVCFFKRPHLSTATQSSKCKYTLCIASKHTRGGLTKHTYTTINETPTVVTFIASRKHWFQCKPTKLFERNHAGQWETAAVCPSGNLFYETHGRHTLSACGSVHCSKYLFISRLRVPARRNIHVTTESTSILNLSRNYECGHTACVVWSVRFSVFLHWPVGRTGVYRVCLTYLSELFLMQWLQVWVNSVY